MKNKHAAALGSMSSERKAAAARENAKRPRKPVCHRCKHTITEHRYRRPSRDGMRAPRRTDCMIDGCQCAAYMPQNRSANTYIGRSVPQ